MLPVQVRVDLGVIAMKVYPAFPKAPASDCLVSYPGHSLEWGGDLTPLQRSSLCILQPQPTGQSLQENVIDDFVLTSLVNSTEK